MKIKLSWGHQEFPGEANSEIRHYLTSYKLTEEIGSGWTMFAGIVNEAQGFELHDLTDLSGRFSVEKPWAFQINDIISNEEGIRDAQRAEQLRC